MPAPKLSSNVETPAERGDSDFDNAEFNPGGGAKQSATSEASAKVPRSEVDELQKDLRPDERDVRSGTRGVKGNAYASENAVDSAVEEAMANDPGQKQ